MDELRELKRNHVWDYENGWYWFSCPSRINKLICHYELYKEILDLPGDIFELGVYKGASLIRFATFRNSLENEHSRRIVGFDSFGTFPREGLEVSDDLDFINRFENSGGDGLGDKELELLLEKKNLKNVRLVKGNVFDTLPSYLRNNPEVRIALLHLDMDVKEPTEFSLDLLYERVVPGGLVVFDDYNSVAGATIAADNFAIRHHLKIKKSKFYSVPAFIKKPVNQF